MTCLSVISTSSELGTLGSSPVLTSPPVCSNKSKYDEEMPRDLSQGSIVQRLTLNLLNTYKEINRKYYEEKRRSTRKVFFQNYKRIFSKYKILSKLGEGATGVVFKAINIFTQESVAIKVNKEVADKDVNNRLREVIETEGCYLKNFLFDVPHAVKLLDKGEIDDQYYALVFEHLGEHNLFEKYLKVPRPFIMSFTMSLEKINIVAKQILEFLSVLKKKELIYGDLKPENMFFDSKEVTVIDFGLVLSEKQPDKPLLYQSLWYRAPEVIIGSDYDCAVDMWSLGTTLYEMYMGVSCFYVGKDTKESQNELLCQMAYRIGVFSKDFLAKGKNTTAFFNYENSAYSFKKWADDDELLQRLQSVEENNFLENTLLTVAKYKQDDFPKIKKLANLIKRMLVYENRITPEEALNHPFFKEESEMSHVISKRKINKKRRFGFRVQRC